MRPIINAAIRIIVIVMALKFLYSLLDAARVLVMIYQKDQEFFTSSLFVSLVEFLFGALILYFLWRSSGRIAAMLAGNVDEKQVIIIAPNERLLAATMSILGIYLLVTSISDMIGLAFYHSYNTSLYGTNFPDELRANEVGQLARGIASVLLGIWLAVGSRGIMKMLRYVWD